MRFIARRLAHAVFLLAGVSVLSFLFYELAPGDFLAEARLNPQISPATIEALQERFGASRPLWSKYLSWLHGALRGDFGHSLSYNSPVAPILVPRAANTLMLTIAAAVIAWFAALACGVLAAKGTARTAGVFEALVSLLMACPELLLALAALMLAMRTGWFPAGGMRSAGMEPTGAVGRLTDLANHLFLPVAVLALGYFPLLASHVRSAVRDALDSPFLEHLRGLGLPEHRILRHALRAASNPLVTLLGFSIGSLLSASLIVEIVFGWPGIGALLLEAILARDLFVVVATILCSSVLLVAGNLAADLLLYRLDPRIRVPE